MLARWRILVAALVLFGCSVTPPDGRFACLVDRDCPATQRCHEQLCYRDPPTTPDAGEPFTTPSDEQPDAALFEDASALDAALPDAEIETSHAPLRVLHASLSSAPLQVVVDDQPAATLTYGQVSSPYQGDARQTHVRVLDGASALLFELTLAMREPTTLLLVDTSAGLSSRVLELPVLPDDPTRSAVSMANTTAVSVLLNAVDSITATGPTMAPAEIYKIAQYTGAVRYLYAVMTGDIALAGFSDLPTSLRASFILIGDPTRPIIDPRGPRLVAIDESSVRTIVPDPMVTFLHLVTPASRIGMVGGALTVPSVTVCFSSGLGTELKMALPYDSDLPRPSVSLPMRENGDEHLHLLQAGEAACSRNPQQSVLFRDLHMSKGRRYLMAINGTQENPKFTLIPEGQRETMTQKTAHMVSLGYASSLLTNGAALRFNFAFWGGVSVNASRPSWAERSTYTSNQPLSLVYDRCWPATTCASATSNVLLAPLASTSAFILAADPIDWAGTPQLRVLTVLAGDGEPWRTIRVAAMSSAM